MTPALPRQHRPCAVYPWCTGHVSPSDTEHHGRAHVVPAREGRELRLGLTADGDGPVRIWIEVSLASGEPPLDVVEMEPADVLQAAATLRQLAMESRERVDR